MTPIGRVPTALHPTDLVRPPGARPILGQRVFRYRQLPHRVQSITIDRVVKAPGRTSVEWTIKSITDQSTFILEPAPSPIGGVHPDGVDVLNRDVVSGPQIKPEGLPPAKALRVSPTRPLPNQGVRVPVQLLGDMGWLTAPGWGPSQRDEQLSAAAERHPNC